MWNQFILLQLLPFYPRLWLLLTIVSVAAPFPQISYGRRKVKESWSKATSVPSFGILHNLANSCITAAQNGSTEKIPSTAVASEVLTHQIKPCQPTTKHYLAPREHAVCSQLICKYLGRNCMATLSRGMEKVRLAKPACCGDLRV